MTGTSVNHKVVSHVNSRALTVLGGRDPQANHHAVLWDCRERDEIRTSRAVAIHAEGVDLPLIGLTGGSMAADTVDAENDSSIAEDSALALDPCERPILVVDREVVT